MALPSVAQEKIDDEVAAGRVQGPFTAAPMPHLVLSPIGLVPKKLPNKFRLIHHLSFPPTKSVNDGIPDESAKVHYTTIDEAIALIRLLGRGCFMCKTDIEKAFRIMPIAPQDHYLLGFNFNGFYYVDTNLPMGLKSSCNFFETFSSAIELVARRQLHITHILHMLDDFMILSSSEVMCQEQLNSFLDLCRRLGVPMSKEKTFNPSTTLTFLGIELDTLAFQARLPLDKLNKCMVSIEVALTKKNITLKHLQQITGLLQFACYVVISGRCFLRRLYNLCIGLTKPYQHVRISPEARKDLLTWKLFLSDFNGTAIFKYDPWISDECLHLFTDASGLGYGAVFGAHWVFGESPLKWKTQPISFLELFPIVISIHLWAPHLRHKRIIFTQTTWH